MVADGSVCTAHRARSEILILGGEGRAILDEVLRHVEMTRRARKVQRLPAVAVGAVDVRADGEQPLDDLTGSNDGVV